MMNSVINWAERGLVPDVLLRAGVRRLLKQRIANEDLGSHEANQKRLKKLLDRFAEGPIAPLPEKANDQHYEVPAQVFALMLGARRKYSCCLWEPDTRTLDQAEELALAETCRRAEIEDGMSVLEMGCGWGSLTLWIAENFPGVKLTAVSNSGSQREFILNIAAERGIDENLTVLTCDMNDFTTEQQFDRIVSVEMFEHMRNYQKLMEQISAWLTPAGKLFVHIFCHQYLTYEFQDRSASDWMSRYFFSGGIMPSENLLLEFQDHLEIQRQWKWDGSHYEKTSNAWLANMDTNRAELLTVMQTAYPPEDVNRWYNRWRLFYIACAELFGYQGGTEWFVAHYLFANKKTRSSTPEIEQRGDKVGGTSGLHRTA